MLLDGQHSPQTALDALPRHILDPKRAVYADHVHCSCVVCQGQTKVPGSLKQILLPKMAIIMSQLFLLHFEGTAETSQLCPCMASESTLVPSSLAAIQSLTCLHRACIRLAEVYMHGAAALPACRMVAALAEYLKVSHRSSISLLAKAKGKMFQPGLPNIKFEQCPADVMDCFESSARTRACDTDSRVRPCLRAHPTDHRGLQRSRYRPASRQPGRFPSRRCAPPNA